VSSNNAAVSGASDHPTSEPSTAPDPAARPVRRPFTAEYRARVVAEYEAAPHGSKAAVLRDDCCLRRVACRGGADQAGLRAGRLRLLNTFPADALRVRGTARVGRGGWGSLRVLEAG